MHTSAGPARRRDPVFRAVLLLLVVAMVAACGDDDSSDVTSTSTSEAAEDTEPNEDDGVELITFNAGLARGFVDLAEARTPAVADAVAELSADIVALQEVWLPADVEAVRAAAGAGGYESVTFLDPMPGESTEVACADGELTDIETCVRENCADVPDDEIADCVLTNCGLEFGALGETCQTCLAANVGSDIDSVLETCSLGADTYAYGGSFGIGLLSRLPVLEQDRLVLESSLNRRAVLYALVDAGELGELHVFATHLSAVFADIPYPGQGSWADEQRAQITAMLEFVDAKAADGEPVVLLGDVNTGPRVGELSGEVPENYAVFTSEGFESPFVDDGAEATCTFCADNPLVGGADDDESVVIDHVLLRDVPGSAAAKRVLDEPVTVEGSEDAVETRLSDHYGVEVTLSPS